MTYVVPKSKPKMILGGWTGLGFGAAFTWLVFFFLVAAEAPELAKALDLAAEVLLAEGLPL